METYAKAQITFAPEFRLPFGEGSVITATPNVMCRYLKQGTATEDCGQGLSLGFKSTSKDGLLNLTAKQVWIVLEVKQPVRLGCSLK